MKKMLKYADEKGKLYYSTSQSRFAQFTKTHEIKSAIFQGETILTRKQAEELTRIGNGVYMKIR